MKIFTNIWAYIIFATIAFVVVVGCIKLLLVVASLLCSALLSFAYSFVFVVVVVAVFPVIIFCVAARRCCN